MELLRRLADTGCTVVCTTHVMENVYLMDQIAIISEGASFSRARPMKRAQDSVSRGSLRFMTHCRPSIQKLFPPSSQHSPANRNRKDPPPCLWQRKRRAFSLPILLQRQFAIFRADIKNLIILLGAADYHRSFGRLGGKRSPAGSIFCLYRYPLVRVQQFGAGDCKELPIYRRERLVGLSRWSYLTSKFIWMAGLTAIQSLLIYATIAIGQARCPWSCSLADYRTNPVGLRRYRHRFDSVGFRQDPRCRPSCWCPCLLIPQILFSGFTVSTKDMAPPVLMLSQIMPSFAPSGSLTLAF